MIVLDEVTLAQDPLDRVPLGHGLNGDGVHAELAAVVPRPLPVELLVLSDGLPREVITFAKALKMNHP